MRQIVDFYESLNSKGKIIMFIVCVCCLGPIGLIGFFIISGIASSERFNNVLNDPTEENVVDFMEKLSGIENHPDTWSKYRGLWNVVNRSSKVTTPTKEKFLAKLMACGLYMNNTKVHDNYDGSYDDCSCDSSYDYNNDMQDEINRQQSEWAAEEARKAVTPFDHGGYVQGDGFNPSDTMAADAQREQMNQMNDMNNMNNMF